MNKLMIHLATYLGSFLFQHSIFLSDVALFFVYGEGLSADALSGSGIT